MRILVVALLVVALACGSGYGWVKPSLKDVGSGASIGRIVGRNMFISPEDIPSQFRHLEDPLVGPFYFLFDDRGYACIVSPEAFTMALDEDRWPCKWRLPRGI